MKFTKYTISQLVVAMILCVASVAQASDWGEIRKVTRDLNIRSTRSVDGKVAMVLSKGEKVKVDFLKDGWVAIFPPNENVRSEKMAVGYARLKYFKLVKASKTSIAVKLKPAPKPLVKPKSVAKPKPAPKPVAKSAPKPVAQKAPAPASKPVAKPVAKPVEPAKGAVTAPVAVAPIATTAPRKGVPVKITSDRMVYDENRKMVSFTGNVVATHEGLVLKANSISAYFQSEDGKKYQVDGINRVVARGNVRAERGKTRGTCGVVTYYVGKRVLVMEDNPVLSDGPNSITGEKIRFYVRENRSEVVSGGGKRVKAIFITPQLIKRQ